MNRFSVPQGAAKLADSKALVHASAGMQGRQVSGPRLTGHTQFWGTQNRLLLSRERQKQKLQANAHRVKSSAPSLARNGQAGTFYSSPRDTDPTFV